MRRIGLVLAIVGTCFVVGGLAFNFLVRLNAFEEFFLKSRLTGILEERGYGVLWEKGNYNDLPSGAREVFEKFWTGEAVPIPTERFIEEWRKASFVHFIETEKGIVFFVERTVHIPQGAIVGGIQKEGPQGMEVSFNTKDLPILHFHGEQKWLRLQGILDIKKAELNEVFPFPEVQSIKGWRDEVGERWLYKAGFTGFIFLTFGALSIALPGIRYVLVLLRRGGPIERVHVIPPPSYSVRLVEIKKVLPPDSIEIVGDEALIPEDMRREFLHEIEAMIDQSEGEKKTRLETIYAELQVEEPRPSKLEYRFAQAKAIFWGEGETEGRGEPEEIKLERGEIEIFPVSEEIDFRSREGLDKLLPIRDFIPKSLNPEYVQKVILWGFLKPGRKGKRFFGEGYIPAEYVLKNVIAKGFSPENVKECFQWLMKVGVITEMKRGHGKLLCSLNPDLGSVPYPGDEIIRVVVRAGQLLTKR